MEGLKNDQKIQRPSHTECGEHWRRFVKSGSIEDYLSFSRARLESKRIDPCEAGGEGDIKN